jgi:hypothetical protein
VKTISELAGEAEAQALADWAVPVQREHVELVRKASLTLAADEGREMAG